MAYVWDLPACSTCLYMTIYAACVEAAPHRGLIDRRLHPPPTIPQSLIMVDIGVNIPLPAQTLGSGGRIRRQPTWTAAPMPSDTPAPPGPPLTHRGDLGLQLLMAIVAPSREEERNTRVFKSPGIGAITSQSPNFASTREAPSRLDILLCRHILLSFALLFKLDRGVQSSSVSKESSCVLIDHWLPNGLQVVMRIPWQPITMKLLNVCIVQG